MFGYQPDATRDSQEFFFSSYGTTAEREIAIPQFSSPSSVNVRNSNPSSFQIPRKTIAWTIFLLGFVAAFGLAASRFMLETTSSIPVPHLTLSTSRDTECGSETGKFTWTASDPIRIAKWWLEVLPTTTNFIGNASCATYGKVFVGIESTNGLHGVNAAFQLHAVRAPVRHSGTWSVRSLERRFSAAVTASLTAQDGQSTPYRHGTALRETLVGLFTSDLDYYARAFAQSGVPFTAMRWTGGCSLLVHLPDSLVVLELIGLELSDTSAALSGVAIQRSWRRIAGALPPRNHEASRDLLGRPALTAIKISQATTNATRDAIWATAVLGASSSISVSADFGEMEVDALAVTWSGDALPVELHFVSMTERTSESTPPSYVSRDVVRDEEEELSVAEMEAYATGVHAEYTADCSICNDTRGFDRFMDTHLGRKNMVDSKRYAAIDEFLAAARSHQSPHTVFRSANGDLYFLYVASPNGLAAQLIGVLEDPPAGCRVFDTCKAY